MQFAHRHPLELLVSGRADRVWEDGDELDPRPSASVRRSSPWIPCPCTGGWILAPPKPALRNVAASRIICSTSSARMKNSPSPSMSVPLTLPARGFWPEATSPCSSGERGCTSAASCGASLTARRQTGACVGGWSARRVTVGTCTTGSPKSMPHRQRGCTLNDQRRIIRALEVFELTGRPASEFQRQSPLPTTDRPRNVYWLSPPRDWLYRRIDARAEQMIADGLVREVEQLLQSPRPLSRTARQALGYREIIEHLSGECPLEEAIVRIQTNTRQFAKRQHTWFRNLGRVSRNPGHGRRIAGRDRRADPHTRR